MAALVMSVPVLSHGGGKSISSPRKNVELQESAAVCSIVYFPVDFQIDSVPICELYSLLF